MSAKNRMRQQKGITLVELVIVLGIMALVIALGMNFFMYGNFVFSKGSSQYNVQSSVRLAATGVTETVRFSTSLDILSDVPPLIDEDPYSYIFLDNNQLVHSYVDGSSRNSRVLASGLSTVLFENNSSDEMLLNISITGEDRAQDYEINQEVGLPNFELFGFAINGTSPGSVLKFYQDKSISVPGSHSGLVLTPGPEIDRYVSELVAFGTNMDVTWTVGGAISLLGSADRTAQIITNNVGIGTITATSVEDNTMTRTTTVNVVPEMTPSIEIVRENNASIYPGALSIQQGDTIDLKVNISQNNTPIDFEDDDRDYDLVSIVWDPLYPPSATSYLAVTPTPNSLYATIEGVYVGANANLTVRVVLNDLVADELIELTFSIIVNVDPDPSFAYLTGITFSSGGTLSPSFNPGINNYSISGTGNSKITASAPAGSTITVNGTAVNSGVEYNYNFNLSQPISIVVTVDDPSPSRAPRNYYITK